MNLKYRLIFIFSFMTVIPLLIMFIMAAYTNYHSIDPTLFDARLKSVHTKATLIQKYIETQKNDLDLLSSAIAANPDSQISLMNLYKKKHNEWEYLYYVDKYGQVTHTFPYTNFQGDNNFSNRPWFNQIRETHQPYMSGTIISSASGATTCFIVYPVLAPDGNFLGVVGANLSLTTLPSDLPADLQPSRDNELFLVDHAAKVLASSAQITAFTPELSVKMSNEDGNVGFYADSSGSKVAFYTAIPGTDWTIYIVQSTAELYEKNHEFLQIGIFVLLMSIIVAVGCSYYLANILTKPLNNLIESFDATSDDYSYTRIDFVKDSNKNYGIPPEIQKLTDSLNHMISKLSLQQSELKELNTSIIETLITLLEINDRYTVGHSHNVSRLSVRLADKLGLNSQLKEMLSVAALLHDIGKIGVNTNILNKPAALTPEEYEVIKKHPFLGFMALQSASKLSEISQIILAHHERYDGQGYPNGLKGENIPFLARIICVADAFDAMYSDRPYRQGLSLDKIISILTAEHGHQFDPLVADAMLELIQEDFVKKQAKIS